MIELVLNGQRSTAIVEGFFAIEDLVNRLDLPPATRRNLIGVTRVAFLFFGDGGPRENGVGGDSPRATYFANLYLACQQILRPYQEKEDVFVIARVPGQKPIQFDMAKISGYTSVIPLARASFDRYAGRIGSGDPNDKLSQFRFVSPFLGGPQLGHIVNQFPAYNLYIQAACHLSIAPYALAGDELEVEWVKSSTSGSPIAGPDSRRLFQRFSAEHMASFMGETRATPNSFTTNRYHRVAAEETSDFGKRIIEKRLDRATYWEKSDTLVESAEQCPIYTGIIPKRVYMRRDRSRQQTEHDGLSFVPSNYWLRVLQLAAEADWDALKRPMDFMASPDFSSSNAVISDGP